MNNPIKPRILRSICTTALSLLIAVVITLSIGPSPALAASVSWDGEAGDGLWSNPLNWAGDTVPLPEDSVTIAGTGANVILDTPLIQRGQITVTGAGNSLTVNPGILLSLQPNLPPGQYDTIIIDGGASLLNLGIIEGTNISSLPRIYAGASSSITNNDTVNLIHVFLRGGSQPGNLVNNGIMLTTRISTLVGAVVNTGTINNCQLNLQFATVSNLPGGLIELTSVLSTMGSRIINGTTITNEGSIVNLSTVDNEGVVDNYGTFDNSGGSFVNTCDFNAGTIGIFNNYGTFTGNPIISEGSIWDDDLGNGLWSLQENWSSNTYPAPVNDIIVNSVNNADTTVYLDTDFTIDGKFGLRNSTGAPVTVRLIIMPGVTLTVNGSVVFGPDTIIENQGTLINNGDIRASGTAWYVENGVYSGNPIIGINTFFDGDGGDRLWSNPLNWNRDVLPATGDYVTISDTAGEVLMDTDFTVLGRITVSGTGNTLTIQPGNTLTLNPDLAPGQYDTVILDNGGSLNNQGTITGTTISPLPRIYLTSTSAYFSDSVMLNSGTVMLTDVYMRGGPDNPTLINSGFMNTVRVGSLVGSFINNGTVSDAQLNFQFGAVNNTATGSLETTLTLSNMGSRLINETIFDNYGILNNNGSIENQSTVNNFNLIDTTGGTFDNQGVVYNYGGTILGTISGNLVIEMAVNDLPVIDPIDDQIIDEGSEFVLPLVAFSDNDTADLHIATIDWGDGWPAEPATVEESEGTGTITGFHTFVDDGTYVVTISLDDGTGTVSSDFVVTVNNVAPTVNAGPDMTVQLGDTVTLMAIFTDPGTLDTHTTQIDWGDGIVETLTVNQTDLTVTGTHTYTDPGTYIATVTVTDDDGDYGIDSVQIIVEASPQDTIDIIEDTIENMEVPQGTENSLDASLDNAQKKLDDENTANDKAAINNIKAAIHKTEAQRGKKLTNEEADQLIEQLELLLNELLNP